MRDAAALEPILDGGERFFAGRGEDDGVRAVRKIAGARFTGRVHAHGGEEADAQISSNDDVVDRKVAVAGAVSGSRRLADVTVVERASCVSERNQPPKRRNPSQEKIVAVFLTGSSQKSLSGPIARAQGGRGESTHHPHVVNVV